MVLVTHKIYKIFVAVYGVLGYQNNVETSVWDEVYEIVNSTVKLQTHIEMTNELLVLDAVNNQNPMTKKDHDYDFNTLINKINNRNKYYC